MDAKHQEVSHIDAPPSYMPSDEDRGSHDRVPRIIQRPKTKEHYGIIFNFLPKISGKLDTAGKGNWKANLYVDTKDVPRLMREGFDWTTSNVILEEGFVGLNEVDPDLKKQGWTVCRHYFLSDLSEEPQWTAWLIVFARAREADLFALFRFNLEDLSPDLISEVYGVNVAQEGLIYVYNFDEPEVNFNCIYGNMPMDGWWPWPKTGSELAAQASSSNKGGQDSVQRPKAPMFSMEGLVNSLLGRI